MNKEMDLKHFENLEYTVVIKKRGNKFILLIPELGIAEKDENLEKAYQRIQLEKERYIKKMIEFDLQDEIIEPEKPISERISDKKIFGPNGTAFIIKVIIILFACVVAAHFIVGSIQSTVTGSIKSIKRLPLSRFTYDNTLALLDKINNVSDEEIENVRLGLKKVVKKVKPIADEFKVLLQDESGDNPKEKN